MDRQRRARWSRMFHVVPSAPVVARFERCVRMSGRVRVASVLGGAAGEGTQQSPERDCYVAGWGVNTVLV